MRVVLQYLPSKARISNVCFDDDYGPPTFKSKFFFMVKKDGKRTKYHLEGFTRSEWLLLAVLTALVQEGTREITLKEYVVLYDYNVSHHGPVKSVPLCTV